MCIYIYIFTWAWFTDTHFPKTMDFVTDPFVDLNPQG